MGIRAALPVLEHALGPDHPWYLQSLVTLGSLRSSAGDLQEAEADRAPLGWPPSSWQRPDRDDDRRDVLLNNLADIYRARGDYAAAEPLFARSIRQIGESVHPRRRQPASFATALQNLGILARQRKDYAAAIADYTRALGIRERLLGPDHPERGRHPDQSLPISIASAGDRDALALGDTSRALRLWEDSVGPYGRETLLVARQHCADLRRRAGDIERALAFERRADAILETQIQLYVATGSERQKLAFMRRARRERTDRTLRCTCGRRPTTPTRRRSRRSCCCSARDASRTR